MNNTERAANRLQARLAWPQAEACANDIADLLITPEIRGVLDAAEMFVTWDAGGRRREEALTALHKAVWALQDARSQSQG